MFVSCRICFRSEIQDKQRFVICEMRMVFSEAVNSLLFDSDMEDKPSDEEQTLNVKI